MSIIRGEVKGRKKKRKIPATRYKSERGHAYLFRALSIGAIYKYPRKARGAR